MFPSGSVSGPLPLSFRTEIRTGVCSSVATLSGRTTGGSLILVTVIVKACSYDSPLASVVRTRML